MTNWELLSKMQELANKNANVPPGIAKLFNSLNLFNSITDPTGYTTCCTVSAQEEVEVKYGCNNPYGDGKDPEYICSDYSDGKCLRAACEKCIERFSLEELD